MAKGRITADALSLGVQRVGNLDGLTKTGARRDSPYAFGQTPTAPSVIEKPEPIAKRPVQTKAISSLESSSPAIEVSREEVPSFSTRQQEEKKPRPQKSQSIEASPQTTSVIKKAEVFPERITLNISEEMRNDINNLALKLQRRRTVKNERITPNTVIRTAITLFLEQLSLEEGDVVNNEQDLYLLMRRRLMK